MIHRLKYICSTEKLLYEDLELLKEIFRYSGYPEHIIRKHFFRALRCNKNKILFKSQRKKIYFGLQNLYPKTQTIVNRLKKICEKVFPFFRLVTYFPKNRNILNLFSKNYKISNRNDNPGVRVYTIPCGDCSQVYIGQTGRNLSKRVNEHK